ncbi:MAG: hypothetical protein NC409_12635 [Clostridium sp.]|nr:hypothetical protein [Clostridium sp.]
MLNRSALYNKMMRSNLRDRTTATIHIGAVNQQAQSGAAPEGVFWKWTDPGSVTDPDAVIGKRYLTWEEKHNRLDGLLCFLPEQEQGDREIPFLGAVTCGICAPEYHPPILFRFSTPHLDIKGLTVRFGESYPETFTVETGSQCREYATDSGDFVTEDVFEDADYMKIIPGNMSKGATRLHIESILFGIGLVLTGKKIINMTIKEKTHPISLELPTVDFRFTLDNQDRYFNANKMDSIINYLERGQQVTAYFTQTLEDGTSETIPAVNAVLDSTWKDKFSTAEFSATDCVYQMDQIYEEGTYRREGISAYALLEDLFYAAGVPEDEYSIDPYLKTVSIRNPLPRDTCANNMLLIANACRCVMKNDRKKKVVIKASFQPELSTTASDGTVYSQADRLLKQIDAAEYIDWQQAFNRVDGALRIPPKNESYSYAGFVSRGISDRNGYFEENPAVTIHASAAFSFYQLSIWFGNVYPAAGTVTCYKDHIMTENFDVIFSGRKEVINHAFVDVDEVQVIFTRAGAYNRIHVLRLSIDEETDFTLFRSNMLEQPVTSKTEKIKDLIAVRSVYSLPAEQEDIFSDKLLISRDKCEFKIEFNNASIPIQIITTIPSNIDVSADGEDVVVDYGAEITAYSNWYCSICFHNPPLTPQEVDMKVVGHVYHISNPQHVLSLNTGGATPDALTNPLIDTKEFAEAYIRWCAQYYQANAEYSLSRFMGDPVLESNDLAYFEDEDISKKLIRVHTVETKFDGTYNGSRCEGRSMERV